MLLDLLESTETICLLFDAVKYMVAVNTVQCAIAHKGRIDGICVMTVTYNLYKFDHLLTLVKCILCTVSI